MIVGLLAMLFMIVTAYIILARFDRLTLSQSSAGAEVEEIIATVDDVLISAVQKSMIDNEGALKIGGDAYTTQPGGPSTPWLAASDPVRNVDPQQDSSHPAAPYNLYWPAVTALNDMAARVQMNYLMFDSFNDDDGTINPAILPGSSSDDTIYNARWSFMDADADGIPDSSFGGSNVTAGVSMLTELANAMSGNPISTDEVKPDDVPSSGSFDSEDQNLYNAWNRFSNSARYLVAARVISHGGMVQVAVPGDPDYDALSWNEIFLRDMFNWVRYPDSGDDYMDANSPSATDDDGDLLRLAWGQAASIEPLLRARGGLLVSRDTDTPELMPTALGEYQRRFNRTFVPEYNSRYKADNRQRFNLASADEWNVWRQSVMMDAEEYNEPSMDPDHPVRTAVRRRLLTTVNNSDDLARDETDLLPNYSTSGLLRWPGIYPGQPKFFLGKIANAFNSDGEFNVDGAPDWGDNGESLDPGYRIVEELASYYAEMLYWYDWSDEAKIGSYSGENAQRLDQAYMLAVNTVAFAAPHDDNGNVDTVKYTVANPNCPLYERTYYGFSPQPFFTQLVSYKVEEEDGTGDDPIEKIALAVELYNPYDSLPSGDEHDLDLTHFAVSINSDFEGTNYESLAALSTLGIDRLPGRNFLYFVIRDVAGTGGNNWFESQTPNPVGVIPLPVNELNGTITVRLWRSNIAGDKWHQVDRIEVDKCNIGTGETECYVNKWRDTTEEPFFGEDPDDKPARWRMTMAYPPESDAADGAPTDTSTGKTPTTVLPSLGMGDSYLDVGRIAPATPLYTMNAGLSHVYIHGSPRPASFPTVGFLAYVPRYAHVYTPNGKRYSASEILYLEWEEKYADANALVPADFGHMPIFTNKQDVNNTCDFDNDELGRVPWGQLVFDYFTTIDPRGENIKPNITEDDIDVRQIPGRIDINNAPWFVLAGIPVIGPSGLASLGGAPAFCNSDYGIMLGVYDNVGLKRRFIGTEDDRLVYSGSGGAEYRLGPQLAQAAASYRDRIVYAENAPAALAAAAWRNDSNAPDAGSFTYRDESRYGDIRGRYDYDYYPDEPEKWKRGFITIGELANVIGFDSSNNDELDELDDSAGEQSVLGGYGAGLYARFGEGDFMKAASLLALIDSHFLTTRSNTFTIYTTLMVRDLDDPQASVRSQVTIDRSNLLPKLMMVDTDSDGLDDWVYRESGDLDGDGTISSGETVPVIIQYDGPPAMVGERQTAYLNTAYEN